MAKNSKQDTLSTLKCSFCGNELDQNPNIRFILNDDHSACICEACAESCHACFHEEQADYIEDLNNINDNMQNDEYVSIHKPSEIKNYLDQYVIGQDHAKDILSVAVYNHYKIINNTNNTDNIEISKSNILMLGSTGSGKTLLLQTLAQYLNVPLAIIDSSKFTAAGYSGADVESSLKMLIQNADGNVSKAEKGIIYFDEFDKIAKRVNETNPKDVGGEAVQQALLKIIEGSIVDIPSGNKRMPNEECTQINTKNILFICGGSFEGIEKIISYRLNKNKSNSTIGFTTTVSSKKEDISFSEAISQVTTEDLKSFGLISEMIGRLPIICTLEDLDKETLVKIMKEPKNALCKQYYKLLKYDNVELEFTDEACEAIAQIAIDKQIGARGIRGIIEPLLLKYMKMCPDGNIQKITITDDYVLNKSDAPKIMYKKTTKEKG